MKHRHRWKIKQIKNLALSDRNENDDVNKAAFNKQKSRMTTTCRTKVNKHFYFLTEFNNLSNASICIV